MIGFECATAKHVQVEEVAGGKHTAACSKLFGVVVVKHAGIIRKKSESSATYAAKQHSATSHLVLTQAAAACTCAAGTATAAALPPAGAACTAAVAAAPLPADARPFRPTCAGNRSLYRSFLM